MAIDTERKRLDALARHADGRKLWGPTWTEASRLRAGKARRRALGASSGIGPFLLLGAAALFWFREPLGLQPLFVAVADRVSGAGLPGCDSLASRYDRAVSGIAGPLAESARSSFARAQMGCAREASAMSSTSRAYACRTAVEHFGRALERRHTLASIPARAVGGTIGVSAAGITAGDDGSSEESIARSLLVECRG